MEDRARAARAWTCWAAQTRAAARAPRGAQTTLTSWDFSLRPDACTRMARAHDVKRQERLVGHSWTKASTREWRASPTSGPDQVDRKQLWM